MSLFRKPESQQPKFRETVGPDFFVGMPMKVYFQINGEHFTYEVEAQKVEHEDSSYSGRKTHVYAYSKGNKVYVSLTVKEEDR